MPQGPDGGTWKVRWTVAEHRIGEISEGMALHCLDVLRRHIEGSATDEDIEAGPALVHVQMFLSRVGLMGGEQDAIEKNLKGGG